MKLEFEHLIPYLNHELKGYFFDDKAELLIGINVVEETIEGIDYGTADIEEFRPLLHPLYRLAEKGYFAELWFEVIATDRDNFDKEELLEICELGLVQLLPFMVIQRLFKDHIDVFGLIDKGLAEAIKSE